MIDSEDQVEVRALIEAITEALHAGDAARLDSLLSDRPGSVHIGTDSCEWWDKAQLVTGVAEAMSAGERPVRAEHRELTIHVFGDVAWAEGTGRFVRDDGAECPIRTTGVFVREGARWKAAQSHASIAVSNEDMFKA